MQFYKTILDSAGARNKVEEKFEKKLVNGKVQMKDAFILREKITYLLHLWKNGDQFLAPRDKQLCKSVTKRMYLISLHSGMKSFTITFLKIRK